MSRNHRCKIFWHLAIILIPPLLLCAVFFPPFRNFKFDPSSVSDRKFVLPPNIGLTTSIIADILQTKISLAWYNACLENDSYATEDGNRIGKATFSQRSTGLSINITSEPSGYTRK